MNILKVRIQETWKRKPKELPHKRVTNTDLWGRLGGDEPSKSIRVSTHGVRPLVDAVGLRDR